MSFLAQLARSSARSAASIRPATAGIHTSTTLNATRHESDPEVLEKGKRANIDQHKNPNAKAEWKEEIASDSEAFVKAVRGSDQSIQELQKESAEKLKGKSREELNQPNMQK
ncbi:hypothetical protein BJ508DRAFT_419473 [Ascobolus immersus RN42]|uniref:Uncharacterized protein n=1 Tax=Ascobolus immersus RN42 TaxID=1160509 RepID=A0A3N4HDT8_ASCIM|nr:hypothetical protein BJ508DRAFT_419473 [Ascobolus immersus RN42]